MYFSGDANPSCLSALDGFMKSVAHDAIRLRSYAGYFPVPIAGFSLYHCLDVPRHRYRSEGSFSVPCLRTFSPLLSPEMPNLVLLCPPTHFDVIDQKNAYMAGGSPINRAKAQEQWQSLCSALEDAGYKVETIAPAPGHEDMVFRGESGLRRFHRTSEKFIVPSRMVHPSRHGAKVPFYVDWYGQRGFKIVQVDLGADYLEGNGDLLWHPGWSRVYGGYGFRSTKFGVEKFGKALSKLEIPVVPLHLVDPYCCHLDITCCPLNNEAVLIYPRGVCCANPRPLCVQLLEAEYTNSLPRRSSQIHVQRHRRQRTLSHSLRHAASGIHAPPGKPVSRCHRYIGVREIRRQPFLHESISAYRKRFNRSTSVYDRTRDRYRDSHHAHHHP